MSDEFVRVLTKDDLRPETLASRFDASRWTAIIPAAGRGTRLGFDRAKVLFPVGDRTILQRLVDLLAPFCDELVFVLAPVHKADVEEQLRRLTGVRYAIAVQEEPSGMADAVRCGLTLVSTENTLIIWGDQVALRPETVMNCIRLHDGPLIPAATLPTLLREDPYIHFARDGTDRIVGVLQRREGHDMPASGENDCGLFLFRTDILRRHLPVLFRDSAAAGESTREINFLPIFPSIDSEGERILSARIVEIEETIGVNTPEEARILSEYLAGIEG